MDAEQEPAAAPEGAKGRQRKQKAAATGGAEQGEFLPGQKQRADTVSVK